MSNFLANEIYAHFPSMDPFRLLDCGSLWGVNWRRWGFLQSRLEAHGFDPDEADCARLNAEAKAYGVPHHYYSCCLGANDGERRKFYLTKSRHSSSLFPPAEKRMVHWRHSHQPPHLQTVLADCALDQIIEVETVSLDAWQRRHSIPRVDFIKLDVQGGELEVLSGGESLLSGALGLEVEVFFVPQYEKQPLFAEIDQYLRGRGFAFFNFLFSHTGHFVGRAASPVALFHQNSTVYLPQSAGQMISADALYLLDPFDYEFFRSKSLPLEQWLKLAIAAEAYEQVEYAFQVVSRVGYELTRTGDTANASLLTDIFQVAAQRYLSASPTQQA